MTAQELIDLNRLSDKVDAGFREMRDLMEKRREEEVRVKEALDARLRNVERISYAAGLLGTCGLAIAGVLINHVL
jgi:hypothetical protein